MSVQAVQPLRVFNDIDGTPLHNGYIYIGTAGLDAQSNPITAYWDSALTQVATQPIRTINGYAVNGSTRSNVYVAGEYSATIKNENGTTLFSSTSANLFSSGNVSFIQSGTGAVNRTAQDKMREIVSAKDFGAVGDGVTNDTSALQAFLNACKDGRGYIPPGKYKITSTLYVYPQYCYNIEGATWDNAGTTGTVIYNSGTGNAITLDNEPYTPPNYDSQIRFANLTVLGNALSQNGFYVRHAMIYLENVWSIYNGANGIYLERGYSSAFKQVTCANNAQNGLSVSYAGNALRFDHCVFNGNSTAGGYAGAYLNGNVSGYNYGVVFNSCDFTGNGASAASGTGIIIQYSRGVSLIGCYGESNKSNSIYSDSTTYNLAVIGCYWQDSTTSITSVDGLVYDNNHHQSVSATTTININAGMASGRYQTRMFGNTYAGGATANPTGGASENLQVWYTAAPTAGTWKRGDIVWNSNLQNGGGNWGWVCLSPGTPGTWLPIGQLPYTYANVGDAGITLTPFASFTTNFWQSPLTANRAVTLSTTGAVSGVKFRITRGTGSTGAFTLDVGTGPLKSLATGQWCDVEYDGSTWRLAAFGSL